MTRTKDKNPKCFGRDQLTIEQMTDNQDDAIRLNHSHFFTGKKCRNGHIAPRTKRGECNQCARDAANRLAAKRRKEYGSVGGSVRDRDKKFRRGLKLFFS